MNIKKIILLFMLLTASPVISQETDSILYKAYKYNSKVLLEEFFMNWENESRLSDEERFQIYEKINSDDTLSEVYKIANAFYKPIHYNAKYFVIEDTLKYEICYSDSFAICKSSQNTLKRTFVVYPFHIESEDSKILYLDAKYNKMFIDFFRSKNTELEKLQEEYSDEKALFDGYLYFENVRYFSGGPSSYHKEHLIVPDLWSITINAKLDRALVSSGGSVSSNVSEWAKKNGNWRFVKVVSESVQ